MRLDLVLLTGSGKATASSGLSVRHWKTGERETKCEGCAKDSVRGGTEQSYAVRLDCAMHGLHHKVCQEKGVYIVLSSVFYYVWKYFIFIGVPSLIRCGSCDKPSVFSVSDSSVSLYFRR